MNSQRYYRALWLGIASHPHPAKLCDSPLQDHTNSLCAYPHKRRKPHSEPRFRAWVKRFRQRPVIMSMNKHGAMLCRKIGLIIIRSNHYPQILNPIVPSFEIFAILFGPYVCKPGIALLSQSQIDIDITMRLWKNFFSCSGAIDIRVKMDRTQWKRQWFSTWLVPYFSVYYFCISFCEIPYITPKTTLFFCLLSTPIFWRLLSYILTHVINTL